MDPESSLAAGIEALDGNTRFRVTLKPWRWSDNRPVTADDVVFCWERIQLLGAIYAYAGQGGIPDLIATVRALNATQVEFTLKKAVNPTWFTLNGLSLIYALPRHAWGDIGRDALWQRQNDPTLATVTDGPFRLAELHDDRYAVFTPNPLYGGHEPQLARLVVTFLEGGHPLHAVQAGEADIARVPYALWRKVQGTPGFHTRALPEPYGYAALVVNLRRPDLAFLRDGAIRRAFAQAIDQQGIIHLVYRGLGTENHVPVPTAAPAWRSDKARAPLQDLAYNPQAAAAALDAAGWRTGADGVRQKAGVHMAFTVLSNADSDEAAEMQALQVVQRGLRGIGVAMTLRRVSLDQYFEILGAPGGWDAASMFVTLSPVPDGSGYFDTNGATNFGAYSDPRMDTLISASVTSPDAAALAAYQDYAGAQQPWIILPQGQYPVMIANRLHGVERMQNPLGFWSPEYLWVETASCHAPDKRALR
jgi:peptide/nickel transport system substrate-binding protein